MASPYVTEISKSTLIISLDVIAVCNTNVPAKCANLYKSNVSTTAYENHTIAKGSDDSDRNFVKNYYFNKDANADGMGNTIVKDLRD